MVGESKSFAVLFQRKLKIGETKYSKASIRWQALALKDQIHENQLLRVANNNATNKSIVQTLLPF